MLHLAQPDSTDASTDSNDKSREPDAMSSRDQLRFMQLWGERRLAPETNQRQETAPKDPASPPLQPQLTALHSVTARRPLAPDVAAAAQPSLTGLTYVPRSAWEGLPTTSIQPLGFEDEPADKVTPEVQMQTELAPLDQLSEESIASVQSFCGGGSPDSLEGGFDNSGTSNSRQDHTLREPLQVAAMLRDIACGRRESYADDTFALRLEREVWAEMHTELDKQNRLDARLEDVSSEEMPSPSSSPAERDIAVGSVSDQITVSAMSAAPQGSQQSLVELQIQTQQRTAKFQGMRGSVGRALADSLGSLKSRLRAGLPRSFSGRSSNNSPSVAGWASTYTETDSVYSDEDTNSSESDRRSNRRCRWRKSRIIRVSQRSSSNQNAVKSSSMPEALSVRSLNDSSSLPLALGPKIYASVAVQDATAALDPAPQTPTRATAPLEPSGQSAAPHGESYLRQSNRFFFVKSGLPLGVEACRITRARRSVSTTSPLTAGLRPASPSALSSTGSSRVRRKPDDAAVAEGGRAELDCQFLFNRHSYGQPKNDELDARFKKQLGNKNCSNHGSKSRVICRLDSTKLLREAEMVARHHTEPHFTSDGAASENRRDLAALRAGKAKNNVSDRDHSETRKRSLVPRRCRHVVLIQPQVVRWDLQLRQTLVNPKARRHKARKQLPSVSTSPRSVSSGPPRSLQSLPTVTSAALKADFTRENPNSITANRAARYSPGRIVHWDRLGQMFSEKRGFARVKQVRGRRWHSRRLAETSSLLRAYCPEVVDNPSLTASYAVSGDLPEEGCIGSATGTTMSTCDAATSTSSISSSCCNSSRTMAKMGRAKITGCQSISVGPVKPTLHLVNCYALPSGKRRRSLGYVKTPGAGDNRLDIAKAADTSGKHPWRQEAPLVPISATTAEELACQPVELATLADSKWVLAKRSGKPKSGYSHSVHYLPSVTVINSKASKLSAAACGPAAAGATTAAAAASSVGTATPATLLIACELTVGRPRRRSITAALPAPQPQEASEPKSI